jgi:hypothetical protein
MEAMRDSNSTHPLREFFVVDSVHVTFSIVRRRLYDCYIGNI